MIKKFVYFIGLTSLLILSSVFFYFSTNAYYNFGFGLRDYSLYGWGMLFAVLGATWRFRHQAFMRLFAVWLIVLCFALECSRFVIYLHDKDFLLYFRIIVGIEIIYMILTYYIGYKTAFMFGICSFVATLSGQYLIYPSIIPMRGMMFFCVLACLLWILGYQLPIKNIRLKKSLQVGLALGVVFSCLYIGWLCYDRVHGIRFYERPVTKVAENIKVSIIVPVYNAEKTLERALDSLRHQTLKDIEIICVNDGSTDTTATILDRYAKHDQRIKVIHQENAYIGGARNRGLQEARGEYVGFIDSDDWVSLNYYENLYKVAKKYDADMASTAVVYIVTKEFPEAKRKRVDREEFEKDEIIDDLAYFEDKALGFVWDKIYRRSLLEKHHILFTTYRTIYEDNYFSTQVYMYANKMANVRDIAYYYYRGGVSVSKGHRLKPTDEAPDMFLRLDEIVRQANMSDEQEKRWLNAAKNIRHFSFSDYYRALIPEYKEIWADKVSKAFPLDDVIFDKFRKKSEDTDNTL